MALSIVTFYGCKGQTTAVIPPAEDVSECDYSDLEDEEYVPVSNNASHLANDSSSDEDDQLPDDETHQQQPTSSTSIPRKKGKQSETKYKWLNGDYSCKTKSRLDFQFTIPNHISSPIDYFNQLFADNLINLIVEQTNLYSAQCTRTSINTNFEEMKTFLAML